MLNFSKAFKGKKVLITGHTGFKGGWLSLWLNELGADVVGYSLPPEGDKNLFRSAGVGDVVRGKDADICNFENLLAFVREERPEFIFHLAAQPLVRRSFQQPLHTFNINVMGTANLLEAVHQVDSVRSCVVITSDKCYENREWVHPYRENDPLGGYDPYSASKGAAELVTASFRRSFFHEDEPRCGIATARAGNVIGGGDWAEDRLIPDCIRSLGQGKKVLVRSPDAIRPWQHVLEPLCGYLMLAAKLRYEPVRYGEAWNFGPTDSGWTVAKVVEEMVKQWGEGSWKDISTEKKLHEAHNLHLDSTKARTILGWTPKLDVRQAIDLTVSWYRHEMSNEDMAAFTKMQIGSYHKACLPMQ
jgi:CDP-glucose 4,6-dehydratase